MLVKDWMSKNVITVDENDSMFDATKIMKKKDIRMLPVMKKGKLVGIATDRDLKRASASDATTLEIHELMYFLSKIKVKEIMTKDPITIPSDYTMEEAAEVLLENKISGVPVVDDRGHVVGVITQTDLFKVIVSLTGLKERGIKFAFQLKDRSGSIKELADVIRKFNGRMAAILTFYNGVKVGYRKVYIRMYNIDRSKLAQLKEELKEKGTLLYMVDLREKEREVYAW
ncbi:MAG: CBS and ACT domain-containing protein [Desulfobacteraceae bacterium]|jgi:acetoin utilization protein AcuB